MRWERKTSDHMSGEAETWKILKTTLLDYQRILLEEALISPAEAQGFLKPVELLEDVRRARIAASVRCYSC